MICNQEYVQIIMTKQKNNKYSIKMSQIKTASCYMLWWITEQLPKKKNLTKESCDDLHSTFLKYDGVINYDENLTNLSAEAFLIFLCDKCHVSTKEETTLKIKG